MAEKDVVELRIIFNPADGSVGLGGPIENQMFCLGLLEMGKIALMNFHREAAEKKACEAIIRLATPGVQHRK